MRRRKTKSGVDRYDVLWREEGRQTSATFDDAVAAEHWRGLLDKHGPQEAARIAGRVMVTPPSRPLTVTVTDWCLTHIDKLTGVQAGTKNRYRRYVELDVADTIGSIPVSVLTHHNVADWVNTMAERSSAKTVRNKFGFLSSAMTTAVRNGLRHDNPCTGVRPPRRDLHDAVFLSVEQFFAVRSLLSERWRPLATFLIGTGLRFSEATALQVGDVVPEAMTVRVRRAWKYTGNKSRELGPPKSRRSKRTINVPRTVIDACGDLGRPSDAFVFVNTVGNPVQSQLFYNTGWTPAVKAAMAGGSPSRLRRRPRIHDLRHTCASMLIKGGTPMLVVRDHMGHEDISTTLNLYGHVDRGQMQKAAEVLGDALESIVEDYGSGAKDDDGEESSPSAVSPQ